MDLRQRKALEAAGWRFGDAADFLGMSDAERQLLDARTEAALAVRRQRIKRKMSQKQLADRINTSQPRVAKIEQAAPDVSLDQILRAFVAAGGRVTVTQAGQVVSGKTVGKSTRRPRSKSKSQAPADICFELDD